MSFVKESTYVSDLEKEEKISYHEEEAKFHFEQSIKHRKESEDHSNRYFRHHYEILMLRNNFNEVSHV